MKLLYYELYCSGNTGLSNLIMSLELGVVLACITDRSLLLAGNLPPSANKVIYDVADVDDAEGSKVTDLFDLPMHWRDISGSVDGEEWPGQPLTNAVYHG